MKKIIVTGATSMIGVAVIEEAIKNNIQVLAIVRKECNKLDRLPNSNLVKIIKCDLENLCQIPFEEQYDVFYHFAWRGTNKIERTNVMVQAKNISDTIKAVQLAKRMKCRKFIGAGSQAEYGIVKDVISENTKTDPVIAYGVAKLSAGKLAKCLCEQYGISFVWGRIFSVYGRYDNEETMINYALNNLLQGRDAHFSVATQKWNYLNEHDAGKIFYLLGKCNNIKGIYCIANEKSMRLKDYIEMIEKQVNSNAKCIYSGNSKDFSDVELQVDISKLKNDINYHRFIPFIDGIQEIVRFKNRS